MNLFKIHKSLVVFSRWITCSMIPGDWNSKSRTLSDQPASCPLCGAIIRQSRNLRRHLELLHFGIGSGGKSGIRCKKDKPDKGFTPRSPSYSRASLTLRDNAHSKSDATDYSTMPSLNLSSAVNSSTSNISVPGSFMLSGSNALGPNDHGHHHGHNNNPAHSIPSVSCPPTSMAPPNNGIYSSDSAGMLSCLLPTLPSLSTLSSPHDMFRHTEFLRANMGYPQDPSRQQHVNRQRTDVT